MRKLYDSKKLCYMSIIFNIVFDIIFTVNTFFGYYIGGIRLDHGHTLINLQCDVSWLTFAYIFTYPFYKITGESRDIYNDVTFLLYTLYIITFVINIFIVKRSKAKILKKISKKLVIIDAICIILAILIFYSLRLMFNGSF